MGLVTSLVLDAAKGKLIDRVIGGFRTHVIERWTRHRAEAFFAEFCDAIADTASIDIDKVDQYLHELLMDDSRSETMYDAYRSVCLSRSKEIGPRVIAIVVARLVSQHRQADAIEESILWIAEQFSDNEFREFRETFDYFLAAAKQQVDPKRPRTIQLDAKRDVLSVEFQFEIMAISTPDAVSIGPQNLAEDFGSWAEKLRSMGIITDDVTQKFRDNGRLEYQDAAIGIEMVSRKLFFGPTAFRLRELLDLVDPNKDHNGTAQATPQRP